MKQLFLILVLSGSFSTLANANVSCLDSFNAAWNEAWDIYDLDKYNCLVDPFSAPFNCEQDALYDRLIREENAVNTFVDCCDSDPSC